MLSEADKKGSADDAEVLKNCRAELLKPGENSWKTIRQDIMDIEHSAYKEEETFDEETLQEDLENPTSIVAILRDTTTGKIIGYSYAQPTSVVYPEFYPERKHAKNTAYITNTAIHPQYQKKRLLPVLLKKLEDELKEKGYAFIERDSADNREKVKEKEETYADKIKKNNADRIIAEEQWSSEDYGQQRFFRIRLEKELAAKKARKH